MKKFTRGAVAGAAGTTALNAVGFADMALRGRRLPDPVVAVAEDALAIGLAAIGSA
ncbi:MAG: hypothetical protein JWO75_6446 [Actinomycetia bacterium]|jgi:hypothetical protein|nr:hypothetical protein [Actinomycetes bacterium]